MPSNVSMTIKDFDANEQWQAFATEFIANGGNSQAACRAAGFHQDTAARTKKQNPNFVEWLTELVKRKRASVRNKADLRLTALIDDGKPMDADMCRTQKLFYQLDDKLVAKSELHVTISQGEKVDMDVIKDLIDAGVAKALRESAVVGQN